MNETQKLLYYLNSLNNKKQFKLFEESENRVEKQILKSNFESQIPQKKMLDHKFDSSHKIDNKTIDESKKKLKSKSVFLF